MTAEQPLLSVRGLKKHYPVESSLIGRQEVDRVRAVDGIGFDIHAGETLGLVGETGCGKSTTATTILRLQEPTEGTIEFDGAEVTELTGADLDRFRRRAQIVFQDPTSTLDPRMTIAESIEEPLRIHGVSDTDRRRKRVERLIDLVGLSDGVGEQYPSSLSGGQKQRVALARALVLNPDLLIADEPVKSLDVSVQASFLALLDRLAETFDLAVLFISHDLNVVRTVADRTAVMYMGEIVEMGPTEVLLHEPDHPYTTALVESIPVPDPDHPRRGPALDGDLPDPSDPPEGCRFHTRCPAVIQPESIDIEEEVWRSIVTFRRSLVTGNLAIEDIGVTDIEYSNDRDGAAVDAATIRETFNLPAELSDSTAQQTLDAAVEAAASGESELALSHLDESFKSVCLRAEPALEETASSHHVACHLFTSGDRRE